MFSRHSSENLTAYVDGRLAAEEARGVEAHLKDCARCREELELVRTGIEVIGQMPVVIAPEVVWEEIERALLDGPAGVHTSVNAARTSAYATRAWTTVIASVVLLVAGVYWRQYRRGWIETDARSHVVVRVGTIGTVEVEPNTRLRVVTDRASEHRFALAHGEIRASISAPPKLFFVDTASGTAVDLGCEYSLESDEEGTGVLRVTRGWVSFQWNGFESLVPAGASCRTRAHAGPGIPYFDDAPANFKSAADRMDAGAMLNEARARDTLTLWHLLSRVEPGERGRVFDRMAALTPVPAGVSRDLALKLDPDTLRRWKDELAWTW